MGQSESARAERMVNMYAYLIRNRTRSFTVAQIHEYLEDLYGEDIILRNVQRDLKRLSEINGTCITTGRRNNKLTYMLEPDMAGKICLPIEKNGLLAMFLIKRIQPFFETQSRNLDQMGKALREISERSCGDLFDDLDIRLEHDAFFLGERSVLNTDNKSLNDMLTALVDRKKLDISYRKSDIGDPEKKVICPVKLILYKNELYFVCISEKNENRNYYIKLCRITSAALKNETFTVKADRLKRIESRLTRSFGMLDDDEPETETVVLKFPPHWGLILSERRFHSSQKLSHDAKGNCILTMQVPVGLDLVQWVLGWSESVEAIKPVKLREMLKQNAKMILQKYK